MNLLETTFCQGTAKVWKLVGKILLVFKIVIPLLVVIFGMIDLGKAVVASKDDEIKKAAKSLGMRALAGVLIFFIPTIVAFVFNMVDSFSEDTDYQTCADCITKPNSCDVNGSY